MVEQEIGETGAAGLAVAHLPTRFRGRSDYFIDDKGRLTLPPQLRKPLLDGGNLTVLDGIAVIWDELTFRDAVDHLESKVASADLDKRQLRLFLSSIQVVQPDAQGRIVVPDRIRVAGGLEREVAVVGVGSRIEIWPSSRFDMEMELQADDSVATLLDRGGF